MLREIRRVPRAVLASRIATAYDATGSALEAHGSADLLAIVGTRDRLLNPTRSIRLFERMTGATIKELPAPHLLAQTHADSVWKAIIAEHRGHAEA